MKRMPHFVVLAAGGTGGHVFPAEALAQELIARGHRLVLITDKRGAAYGGTLGSLETRHITAGSLAGQGLFGRAKGLVNLGIGILQAKALLTEMKPEVVVGFGGYAAAPTMIAALQLGLPTVIHEQNAVLGLANRLLAGKVDQVCTSFELAKKAPKDARITLTGMPVRPAIVATSYTPYRAPDATGTIRLLVLGGSQGARVFSDVIPDAVKLLPLELRRRLEISQQSRPEDLDRAHQAYVGSDAHVQLRHFFDNVPELLAKTHLLISRSGASTVAEVSAAGRPSLLVPYPFAADDHQSANARNLEAAGGAVVMPQNKFTPETLAEQLVRLLTQPQLLAGAAQSAVAFAIPDAANRLANVVTGVLQDENGERAKTGAAAASVSTHSMKRGAA
ncbi:MAG: undecaprenyldiphospho-muramoylpentapeptide beta-N-acetylglucosaminyltransferase [Rhodospirillaceae bacterium]|nr:undecaprenyldiphospho-muramoylpentapeptide beta-N-acetylglucosaminyltransferase [Rhodospirillaceae bacterium]